MTSPTYPIATALGARKLRPEELAEKQRIIRAEAPRDRLMAAYTEFETIDHTNKRPKLEYKKIDGSPFDLQAELDKCHKTLTEIPFLGSAANLINAVRDHRPRYRQDLPLDVVGFSVVHDRLFKLYLYCATTDQILILDRDMTNGFVSHRSSRLKGTITPGLFLANAVATTTNITYSVINPNLF